MTLASVEFVPVHRLPESVKKKLLADGKIDETTRFVEIQIHDGKTEE